MTDLSILNEQNLRVLLGELSDWCFHMRKHLGINASKWWRRCIGIEPIYDSVSAAHAGLKSGAPTSGAASSVHIT